MGDWSLDESAITTTGGGWLRIIVSKPTRGGRSVDVTVFRNALSTVVSYSSADPFGDSTCVLQFPQISVLDDLESPELTHWLGHYANVDLWWVPALPAGPNYPSAPKVIDPRSNQPGLVVPMYKRGSGIAPGTLNAVKLWEGFITSLDFTDSDTSSQLEVQCQGALFQLDRYNQKPFFPARPWPLEKLIADAFSHARKPHLRTRPLVTAWPRGWTKRAPKYSRNTATALTPVAKPGERWTGRTSRATGSWEHTLTGFVQDTLLDMIVDNDSGVTPGNQWTITQQRRATGKFGRTPILQVRDRFAAPDFTLRAGTPGVKLSLSADSTQSENVIYGEGTDVNGESWRNAVVSSSRTDYAPLAAAVAVWPRPAAADAGHNRGRFVTESFVKFGTGFSQEDAVTVAEQQLARDQIPGYSGTITLSVDPSTLIPRWLVHAGMTVKVKNLFGSGENGINFHIASVVASPGDGTVTLTVDTRYRDLLTVDESLQRTRDPLSPTRMLQVGKTSVQIEDVQAPWDYSAGSGFIPREAVQFYKHKPVQQVFPYADWVKAHPPLHHSRWYVKVNAAAPTPNGRWTRKAVPILTSEKGSIARSEFFVCDALGNLLKIPFHVSIYYTPVTYMAMPRESGQSSPYLDNAFEKIDPQTGQEFPPDWLRGPDKYLIIGWGNKANGILNRAGFSPGSEAEGGQPTGKLFDDTVWSFDNTSTDNTEYNRNARPGQRQKDAAIELFAMFYAEYHEPVYFGGRLYRQNPGAG